MSENEGSERFKEEWGEVLYFDSAGWCWGSWEDKAAVGCGRSDDVKELLADPNGKTGNEIVDRILELERRLRKEKSIENGRTTGSFKARATGRQRVVGTGGLRARPATHAEHKPLDTRHNAPGKRLPLRQAQSDRTSIHRG